MSNEETKEAVVEETKAEETKVEEAKVEEAEVEVTKAEPTDVVEEELSPWYVFCSQGCGFCKKAEPIYEELNASGKYPEILKLDMAEPDNQKLNKELSEEYGIQCGTPWFINADTGKSICGFREKDVLIKWLNGEDIPVPPKPTGPPPKWPFEGASKKETTKWTTDYNKWLEDNKHMPEDWQKRNQSAEDILAGPRAKSDPPRPPMGPKLVDATDEELDKWGEEYQKWADENKHLPNIQPSSSIVSNIKNRRNQMKNQRQPGQPPQGAPQGAPGAAGLNPDQNARITRLEQKLDKLIKHLGVK